jgi:uncharacterized protein with PIN domain
MEQASFRFYAELNDFLPPYKRQVAFAHPFGERASIKDMVEALGIPHPEIDLLLVNGESVDFSYLVQDGDQVSVYPRFKSIDIASLTHVRPQPLSAPRFILDIHLGKLTTYLRILGFDALYQNDFPDEVLAQRSRDEGRILLTRDRGLLKRSIVTHGYCVRTTHPWRQLIEVIRHFNLSRAITPFQRCPHCNGLTQPTSKELIRDRLPPKVQQYYDEFRVCQNCGQIYWKGTHYDHMQRFIRLLARIAQRTST